MDTVITLICILVMGVISAAVIELSARGVMLLYSIIRRFFR